MSILFHIVGNENIKYVRKNKNLRLDPMKVLSCCRGTCCLTTSKYLKIMCPHLKVHFQYQFKFITLLPYFSIIFLFNIGSFVALKITVQKPDLFIHPFIQQDFYSTDHVLDTILNVLKN